MGESVIPAAGDAKQPPLDRLINLTEHEIALATQEPPDPEDDQGSTVPSTVRLPPQGHFARVDDDRARLGQRWLDTDSGQVSLTWMRRSARVRDLPKPQPGTRYVVSRLTALAARRRGDLAFPFDEVRNATGGITGARGIATFRPWWAPVQWWRDRIAARRALLGARVPGKLWLTGVMFASATALLSGALGLWPGVADNARKNGWGGGGQLWTAWLTVAFTALGATLLGAAAWRWRKRGMILDEHGTAYVIEEQAITWRHEEKASVLADISAGFATVLRVPGPEAMGENWRWQADAHTAPQWDARTDQLVHAFWAVHYNDNQVTRNALFTWAPWPVAMAFGARATARRRGLVLHVRQRPSYGANGPRQKLRLTHTPHDFLRDKTPTPLEETAPNHTPAHLHGNLAVKAEPLTLHDAGDSRSLHWPSGVPSDQPAHVGLGKVLLLLVRITHGPIGPIEIDLPRTPEVTLHVPPGLSALLPHEPHLVPVAEWRLETRAGVPMSHLPWSAFPAAAELICDWVVEQAHAHPGHVPLLATRLPQELAVGLGIQLGQGPRRVSPNVSAARKGSPVRHRVLPWPDHMYPVYFTGRGRLVVPELRLGAGSVLPERG